MELNSVFLRLATESSVSGRPVQVSQTCPGVSETCSVCSKTAICLYSLYFHCIQGTSSNGMFTGCLLNFQIGESSTLIVFPEFPRNSDRGITFPRPMDLLLSRARTYAKKEICSPPRLEASKDITNMNRDTASRMRESQPRTHQAACRSNTVSLRATHDMQRLKCRGSSAEAQVRRQDV
jgi:hypothetical protein